MSNEIVREGNTLTVRIGVPRLDGEYQISKELEVGEYLKEGVTTLVLDLDKVEYINSLGISEFINVHRRFLEVCDPPHTFRMINVDRRVSSILELVDLHKVADIDLK